MNILFYTQIIFLVTKVTTKSFHAKNCLVSKLINFFRLILHDNLK